MNGATKHAQFMEKVRESGHISPYREQVVFHADKVQERMVAVLREYLQYDVTPNKIDRAKHLSVTRKEFGLLLQQLIMFGLCIGVDAEEALEEAAEASDPESA